MATSVEHLQQSEQSYHTLYMPFAQIEDEKDALHYFWALVYWRILVIGQDSVGTSIDIAISQLGYFTKHIATKAEYDKLKRWNDFFQYEYYRGRLKSE